MGQRIRNIMNHTVFHIDGGAGRVIAAIPALLKFHKNNPNDDFKVLVGGCGCQ